jgi:peptide chain release factor 1
MKLSLHTKLDQLALRQDELDAMLSAEDATRDLDRYRSLTKERAEIAPVVARFRDYLAAEHDLVTADEIAQDPGMRAFAEEERTAATEKMAALAADLQQMLLPKDPNDDRNVFLEIRAGTGGDESALFAGDLCRMYARYAERNRWAVEIVSASSAELGGDKEVILRVAGQGAYSKLKFESGGHRVQRVPATEAQGRIHTSACTVAVLPEADAIADITINPTELRIDTFRSSVPAANTSTRPTRRFASRTCRPVSSSSARTIDRSTAIARRRWPCSRRACSTRNGPSDRRRKLHIARA